MRLSPRLCLALLSVFFSAGCIAEKKSIWDGPKKFYYATGPSDKCGNVPDKVIPKTKGVSYCDGRNPGDEVCVCVHSGDQIVLMERLLGIALTAGIMFDPNTTPIIINKFPIEDFNEETRYKLECGKCKRHGVFLPKFKNEEILKRLIYREHLDGIHDMLTWVRGLVADRTEDDVAKELYGETVDKYLLKNDNFSSPVDMTNRLKVYRTDYPPRCDLDPHPPENELVAGHNKLCRWKKDIVCLCSQATQAHKDSYQLGMALLGWGEWFPKEAPLELENWFPLLGFSDQGYTGLCLECWPKGEVRRAARLQFGEDEDDIEEEQNDDDELVMIPVMDRDGAGLAGSLTIAMMHHSLERVMATAQIMQATPK